MDSRNKIIREAQYIKVTIKFPKKKGGNINDLKWMIRPWMTGAELIRNVRNNMKLEPEKTFFLCSNSVIISGNMLIGSLHDKYKNDRGILEIVCLEENVFG